MQLTKTKCFPVLYYGLEASALRKAQYNSINYVLNSSCRKVFNTKSQEAIYVCLGMFNCRPPQQVFSERELTLTFAICCRPSVCRLSSVCLSVTFVRPTQAVQIFGNISMALGILAIQRHPLKILWRSSKGNPSAGGVKHKRGSKI